MIVLKIVAKKLVVSKIKNYNIKEFKAVIIFN